MRRACLGSQTSPRREEAAVNALRLLPTGVAVLFRGFWGAHSSARSQCESPLYPARLLARPPATAAAPAPHPPATLWV